MRNPIELTIALVVVVVAAAGCGPSLTVQDPFAPDPGSAADSLHTYASHAQVPLQVRNTSPFSNVDGIAPKASGSVSLDPATKRAVTSDGVLTFAILTGDAGDGTLTLVDQGGNLVATHAIHVEDADAMAFAVTAPKTAGIDLPDVDITKIRIFAGSAAAFRTTLTHGGDEVLGLLAVKATAPDGSGVTTRNGAGCAADTCSAQRNALQLSVAGGTTSAVDVAVTAGTASATLHVVPSTDADVTDVVLDQATTVVDNKGSLVAHVVAGTEPVFGAPVVWSVDGTTIDNKDGTHVQGDALQFDAEATSTNKNVKPATHDISAVLAGQQASATVAGVAGTFQVTSITGACAAAPGSSAAVAVLLVCLARRRHARR